jgi:GH15 family glucan-1,4-alpha-glucosidase
VRRRIADYGLIGDGRTAALVGRDGAVEWLCWPRYDSDACFAALLGDEENGFWRIAPEGEAQASRRYLGDTLVLETRFDTPGGAVRVIDFLPCGDGPPSLVRIVEGVSGQVAMRSEIALRFGYGLTHPVVRPLGPKEVDVVGGPDGVTLRGDVEIVRGDGRGVSRFEVAAGERVGFVLSWRPSHSPPAPPMDAAAKLQETCAWWEAWARAIRYDGPRRGQVVRSLLTLKALAHRDTGGIVAAATASLPERIGGGRNWDYRYCWLRDAAFTILVLLHVGLTQEAEAWLGWLRRAVGGEPIGVQPFFGVGGERRAPEWEAEWLKGFEGSTPVRFGNAASGQLQLDVFGEVIDAVFFAGRHGLGRTAGADDLMRQLAAGVERLRREPDAGLWESRGPQKLHTYSQVMCWAAFDRVSRWFETDDPALSARYRALAEQAHAEVLSRGFDAELNSFVRAYDDRVLDAAALRIPLVGFLPPDDPRIVGTVEAIERSLMRDGLVQRYAEDTDDGVKGPEGAFLAVGFWMVDAYALQGRREEARTLFERLCGTANDLGLMAEEVGRSGELLGNFPQALSHLALVGAGLTLASDGSPSQSRSAMANPLEDG